MSVDLVDESNVQLMSNMYKVFLDDLFDYNILPFAWPISGMEYLSTDNQLVSTLNRYSSDPLGLGRDAFVSDRSAQNAILLINQNKKSIGKKQRE